MLINFYYEEPSRSLNSYAGELELLAGAIVSVSTTSQLFWHVALVNKFRPKNLERAVEYLTYIATVNPWSIKYGDEKHLTGRDVYNRNNRRNPFTGLTPPLVAPPDFRNTYSLTGFCGVDRRSTPVFYTIHDGTNDALEFQNAIMMAIEAEWFHYGDILVLDNAAIHSGGANSDWKIGFGTSFTLWYCFCLLALLS